MDDGTWWTVGELAHASGVSVRVLRHWDALGVVSPERTPSGHRRYGPAHVTRLYRALALRRTGLGLRQVAALLDREDPDPAATLRAHLDDVEEDLRRRSRLRDRLVAALGSAGPDQLMKVIETMTMFEQYVHGYRPEESTRLADQAGALVELLHGDTRFQPGERVLEMGCGVGAQTTALASRSPHTHFVSADIATDSLKSASGRVAAAGLTNVEFVEKDVFALPEPEGGFAEASFDHVFVCFLLEHLPAPVDALRRLRRLVRPGGTITVIEGDHGSAYFHPDDEAARAAVACQVTLQRHAGGDALIGRRLFPLLHEADWSDIAVSPRTVYVDGSRPELAESFTRRTFTAMISGVREPAVAAGLIDARTFDAGIAALRRTAEPDGVFCYTFFKAVAHRRNRAQGAVGARMPARK
ncbi:methyltransferase domain-containing protein [Streptomyces sp. NA03103]|uniref:methyltransferase domain-containing protein n=1 Tax=unclassified Streptomyces TaxID=2593676 RepID=UPI00158FC099|nr:methyltransferase domain-containing protein [Streptomyces sp. NA03103]QKW62700.1 methyltransferase domain-containing protein [Streptomyces sp. NA03103]